MIGRLNHVAIAVPDLAAASALYRWTLGAEVSEPLDLPEHGVTTVFVTLPNTKLELLASAWREIAHRGLPRPRIRRAVSIISVTRWTTSLRRATDWWRKARECTGRRRAEHRRARQAGDLPPSQGFLRHADRAGAGLRSAAVDAFGIIVVFVIAWWLSFFVALPFGIRPIENPEPGHAPPAPLSALDFGARRQSPPHGRQRDHRRHRRHRRGRLALARDLRGIDAGRGRWP